MKCIKQYDREYRQYLRENPDSLLAANFEFTSAIHQLYKSMAATRVMRNIKWFQLWLSLRVSNLTR